MKNHWLGKMNLYFIATDPDLHEEYFIPHIKQRTRYIQQCLKMKNDEDIVSEIVNLCIEKTKYLRHTGSSENYFTNIILCYLKHISLTKLR